MAAIYGIFGEADSGGLPAMAARLAHRGMEGGEFSPAERVHLGWRTQPGRELPARFDAPIVFDGFVDNSEEVWARVNPSVRGESVPSDAMLVFEVFRKLGAGGFGHLSGHFAIVIWDEVNHCLVLARDRFGARPLYFARTTDPPVLG